MRTTVNIDDDVLAQARLVSARSGRSLGAVVSDALRVSLTERDTPAARPVVAFPTFGGTGLKPGVDLEDKDALARLLGDESPADAK